LLLAGAQVARLLRQSWRFSPGTADLTGPELEEITPLVLAAGGAGLAWRRLPDALRDTVAGQELRQAYRLQVLTEAIHERALSELACLCGAGKAALLGKGWAAARLYPEPGLRPYGDFDLYVPTHAFRRAERILAEAPPARASVDLHRGFGLLDDRLPEVLAEHAVSIGPLRVFGEEDHLRLLCLHLLGHGAWRPLWLCDVALAIEGRSSAFDWSYFLSGSPLRTDWALGAISLARDLLGASLEGAPPLVGEHEVPPWLPLATLRQWGAGQEPHGARKPMRDVLADREGLWQALLVRWPNPIEASIGRRWRFSRAPRLPSQLQECFARVTAFIRAS
jgi:hypothetical protein